jgi:hypothetical protein
MRRIKRGAETFGLASGESLDLRVSDPGECVSLADFASRTILACRLIGYEIVAESPPRTLGDFDRSAWVVELVRQHTGVDLLPPGECPIFVSVDEPDRLEMVLGSGPEFVVFCWQIDREWQDSSLGRSRG